MRVIVAGGRDFSDKQLLFDVLDKEFGNCLNELTIISGHARGADEFGEEWAKLHGVNLEIYPAEWEKHGRAAGPIRNHAMIDVASHFIGFWDGKSRGTRDGIDYSIKKGIWLKVVRYDNNKHNNG